MNSSKDSKTQIMIFSVSLVLIISGVYFFVTDLAATRDVPVEEFLSNSVYIIAGIATAVFFRNNIRKATATVLISMAAATLLVNVTRMSSYNVEESLMSVVFSIAAVVLVYYSLSIIFMTSASSIKAIVLLFVMWMVDLIPLILAIHNGMFIVSLLVTYADNIIRTAMYAVVIFILTRKEMMLDSFQKRLRRNTEVVFSTMCTDPRTYINRYGVRTLLSNDDIGWTYLENGPIERERIVPLLSRVQITELFLQKWKGDDRLHVTVRNRRAHSFVIIMSFIAEKIVLDNEDIVQAKKVRIYGTDGIFVDIQIMDPTEKRKGYIETIKWKRQKRKNEKYGFVRDHERNEFY